MWISGESEHCWTSVITLKDWRMLETSIWLLDACGDTGEKSVRVSNPETGDFGVSASSEALFRCIFFFISGEIRLASSSICDGDDISFVSSDTSLIRAIFGRFLEMSGFWGGDGSWIASLGHRPPTPVVAIFGSVFSGFSRTSFSSILTSSYSGLFYTSKPPLPPYFYTKPTPDPFEKLRKSRLYPSFILKLVCRLAIFDCEWRKVFCSVEKWDSVTSRIVWLSVYRPLEGSVIPLDG